MSLRKNVGGGSFLAGYKRAFADQSALELHGAVGLQSLLSVQHTVPLGPESSGSLVASWQPKAGLGLQVWCATAPLHSHCSVPSSHLPGHVPLCPSPCCHPLPWPLSRPPHSIHPSSPSVCLRSL